MKKNILLLLIFFPLFSFTQEPLRFASKCYAQNDHVLFLHNNSLGLRDVVNKTDFNYDNFLVSKVKDISSLDGFVNVILTEQEILILDNKLALIKKIYLPVMGIIRPQQIAIESIHYIWLYDNFENKLVKISTCSENVQHDIYINFLCDSIKEMIFTGNKLYFLCKRGLFSVDQLYQMDLEKKIEAQDFVFVTGQAYFLCNNKVINSQGKIVYDIKKIQCIEGAAGDSLLVRSDGQCFWIKSN